MTQMALFGVGSKSEAAAAALNAPAARHKGPQRAQWSRLVLKSLPPCSACLRHAHSVWRDGVTPYTGIARARMRRIAVDSSGVRTSDDYCSPCGERLQAADAAAAKTAQPVRRLMSRPR